MIFIGPSPPLQQYSKEDWHIATKKINKHERIAKIPRSVPPRFQNQRVEILLQKRKHKKTKRINVVNRLLGSLFSLRTININTSHYSILSLRTSRLRSSIFRQESVNGSISVRKGYFKGCRGGWEGREVPSSHKWRTYERKKWRIRIQASVE